MFLHCTFGVMEFGRVEHTDELDQIDFTLPADSIITKQTLALGKPHPSPKIYVGCAKWGRADWVGKIYPPKTKAADFLSAYGRQYNSIELNAIYYKLPSHEQIRKWRDSVSDDFLFCPKFSDVITHIKRMKNTKAEVDAFLDVMSEFEHKLGPIFLMPHPQTAPKSVDVLHTFLDELPQDLPVFVEYRHKDWFLPENESLSFGKLQQRKVGIVITDTAGRRDVAHTNLTTPHAFIRFVGNSLHASDYKRIDEWVQRIKFWLDNGLQSLYFFMHQHDELYSPELSKYLIEQLNLVCGLQLKVPVFYQEQQNLPTLF